MEVIFSEEFKKDFRKIKNKDIRLKIIKQLKKLATTPESGKPLQYNLKNHRSIRIKPHRIIYRLADELVLIVCFDHRGRVYEAK